MIEHEVVNGRCYTVMTDAEVTQIHQCSTTNHSFENPSSALRTPSPCFRKEENHEGSYSEEIAHHLVFDLAYLGGVDVVGEAGQAFLQGQLTCDMRRVNHETMQWGALCDLKGRIQLLLDVVDWHGLSLIVPNDLSVSVQTLLNKVASLSKVRLISSTKFRVFGFQLSQREDKIPFNARLPRAKGAVIQTSTYCCYHLGERLYIFLVKMEAIPTFCQTFSTKQWRGSSTWHALQLMLHRPEIYPCSQGLFLPHRLGLQDMGYLSFDKGCYKGQEIIARMHYRSTIKHVLRVTLLEAEITLQAGEPILDAHTGEKVGEVIDHARLGQHRYCVAMSLLKTTAMHVMIQNQPLILECVG